MWSYGEFDLTVKLGVLVVAGVLAVRLSPRRTPGVRRWKTGMRRLATHPWWCALILFGLSLGSNLLLASVRGQPMPWEHDEYSYLLASDTFASGRLTNPTHPLWEHFESFHILSQPSYTSKYPPANGLFMAAGQSVTGRPIVGVWLALALATVATYWMLRVWTSSQWALWGGLVIAVNGPLLHAWGQTYWGGAVAFLGGALVFGGLRRIVVQGKVRDSVLCGSGLVLLAISRPMEGFLVSLPVFAVLAWWLFQSNQIPGRQKILAVLLPLLLIGGCAVTGMGIYNHAVTGDVTSMPYQMHDQTYSASSLVIWKQPPEIPQYNHTRMKQYYLQWGRDRQLSLQSTDNFLANLQRKSGMLWSFFPLGLGLALLAIPVLRRESWYCLALLILGGLLLVHVPLSTSWIFPHYLAPAAALFFAVNVQCLRYLRIWHRQTQLGSTIVRVALVFAVLKFVPYLAVQPGNSPNHPRDQISKRLLADHEPDLVIVSYDESYRVNDEWVYNAADIDAAPIVWARDMGQEQNAQLLKYFAGRKIWRWHLVNDEVSTLQEYGSSNDGYANSVHSGKQIAK